MTETTGTSHSMNKVFPLLAALASVPFAPGAFAQGAQFAPMVEAHAKANGLPVALVHRVIMRESKYQPNLIGKGGTIGLMQIKLPTARSLGYGGTAEGLRDPQTNLTYGVKYLAGAYRTANGNHDQAVSYYARGYYYAAKRQRMGQQPHGHHKPAPEPLPPRMDELTSASAVQAEKP